MGSRGSRPYELDRKEMQRYKIEGYVLDGEILAGKDKRNHTLPEISHKPDVKYIKLNPDNSFRELRIYKNHRLILEIAYHSEKSCLGTTYQFSMPMISTENSIRNIQRHVT